MRLQKSVFAIFEDPWSTVVTYGDSKEILRLRLFRCVDGYLATATTVFVKMTISG